MTLAPSMSPIIPFPAPLAVVPPLAPVTALAIDETAVDATELVAFAARLDAHAVREGGRVSAQAVVARAFLVASLRHPGVDARWPLLPARHGMRLSELTAALEQAEGAAPIPDDAAILSIGSPAPDGAGGFAIAIRIAFDPRRTDAIAAHRMLDDLAGLLADPWELVAHC